MLVVRMVPVVLVVRVGLLLLLLHAWHGPAIARVGPRWQHPQVA